MVSQLVLSLRGLTETQATAGATAITTRLRAKSRWGVESCNTFPDMFPSEGYVLRAEARYTTKNNRDSVLGNILTWLDANVPVGVVGSVCVHDCSHDGPFDACVGTTVWSR